MQQAESQINLPDLRQVGLDPNFWYPMARSKALKKGKTLAVSFAGQKIVLVRYENGAVYALEDRCAHRQYPLSEGVVVGNRLKCGYHAWEYDPDGQVAKIPNLDKDSPKPPRCVKSYHCREAYEHIFIFPGEQDKAEEVSLPEVPNWGDPQFMPMFFENKVGCHYSFMHENLMDMSHQFLHRKVLGGLKATLIEKLLGDNWVQAQYQFQSGEGKKNIGADFVMSGSEQSKKVKEPDIMTIRTEYPYQTLSLRRNGDKEPAMTLWAVYVPIDSAQHVNNDFGIQMIKKPSIKGLIYLLWPVMRWFSRKVFVEDRTAVEAEQRAYDRQKGDCNNEVSSLILELRSLLIRKGKSL